MGNNKKETLHDLFLGIAISLLFLCWGLFIFFMVGDKGQPPWDFGVAEDIPGQSPYSTAPHDLQSQRKMKQDTEWNQFNPDIYF